MAGATTEPDEGEDMEAEVTEEAEGEGEAAAPTGGTVFYGTDQEFSSLNNNIADQNRAANSVVLTIVLPTFFPFGGPDGFQQMDTELLDSAELVSEDPQVVEYVINADAVWSDGEPFDCDDVFLQWIAENETVPARDENGEPMFDETGPEPIPLWAFQPAGTDASSRIESMECSEDGKTITTTYSEPFPEWETTFGDMVPAHVVEREAGVDDLIAAYEADDQEALAALAEVYTTVFTTEPGTVPEDIFLSANRYIMDSWDAGSSVTLVRNENYWGTPANIDSLVYRTVAEEAQPQALANGDIDVMDPQPTPDLLAATEGLEGVVVEPASAWVWEHFDFNFRNPALQNRDVREAFALCLPRQQMVTNLIDPVSPGAIVLNNRLLQEFEPAYEDTSGGLYDEVDIERASELLANSGEELPITLRIGWNDTGGNIRRTNQVALTMESCGQVEGFEIVDAGDPTFFEGILDAGEAWDVAMFAWAGSPQKSGNAGLFGTGGGNNNGNYSNPEVDELLDQMLSSFDEDEVMALANQIDAILWEDLATIPVFSFPAVAAWNERIQGVVFNPSQNGILWNAYEWTLEE